MGGRARKEKNSDTNSRVGLVWFRDDFWNDVWIEWMGTYHEMGRLFSSSIYIYIYIYILARSCRYPSTLDAADFAVLLALSAVLSYLRHLLAMSAVLSTSVAPAGQGVTGIQRPWTGAERPWTGVEKPWTGVQNPEVRRDGRNASQDAGRTASRAPGRFWHAGRRVPRAPWKPRRPAEGGPRGTCTLLTLLASASRGTSWQNISLDSSPPRLTYLNYY